MKISEKKYEKLEKLSNKDGVIAALAIDQRGAMEKMLPNLQGEERTAFIQKYKSAVAKELTPFASSILLDPVYGLDAISYKAKDCGLLLAYEVTGYRNEFRQLSLLDGWSAKRILEAGGDACKILLYYDVDDTEKNNDLKKACIERIGSECFAEDLPFFLEIITYDNKIGDTSSKEFAKVKPHKVNEAVREFTKERYRVDVLKLEVPVNMKYVEGYGEDIVYSKEEAAAFFKEQATISEIPFIYLSAGVSTELFQETLRFAKQAGCKFHGVLCGRATWKNGVFEMLKSEKQGLDWLKTTGTSNIESLNRVIRETCTTWKEKLEK